MRQISTSTGLPFPLHARGADWSGPWLTGGFTIMREEQMCEHVARLHAGRAIRRVSNSGAVAPATAVRFCRAAARHRGGPL